MAEISLILSSTRIALTSSNRVGALVETDGNDYNCVRTYPQVYGSITASLPANLIGKITITDITLNQTVTQSGSGTGGAYFSKTQIIEQLNSGAATSFSIGYSYQNNPATEYSTKTASTYRAWIASGANSSTRVWSSIDCIITYTLNQSLRFTSTSVAPEESLEMHFRFTPEEDIAAGALNAIVQNNDEGTITNLLNYNNINEDALISGTTYTLSATTENNYMGNNEGNQVALLNNSNELETFSLENPIYFVNARQAPTVNTIDGTVTGKILNLAASNNNSVIWTNQTSLILTCGEIITDSNTDAQIVEARLILTPTGNSNSNPIEIALTLNNINTLENNDVIYNLWELNPLNNSIFSDTDTSLICTYSLQLTDSYESTTTINADSSDTIEIKQYIAPSFNNNFTIQRYVTDSVTQNQEASSLGDTLWVYGNLFLSSTDDTYLTFTWTDENNVTQTISRLTAQAFYDKDTTIFSTYTFSTDREYTITATLEDGFTIRSLEIMIEKATGYFNIERGGIAVGGIAHGTITNPMFECYYPMYLVFNGYRYKVTTQQINNSLCLVLDESSITPIVPVSATTVIMTGTYSSIDSNNNYYYTFTSNGSFTLGTTYSVEMTIKAKNVTSDARRMKFGYYFPSGTLYAGISSSGDAVDFSSSAISSYGTASTTQTLGNYTATAQDLDFSSNFYTAIWVAYNGYVKVGANSYVSQADAPQITITFTPMA